MPFCRAIAKRYVTPISVSTRSALMPARISFSSRFREYMPTSHAATYASAPMLIGSSGADDEEGDECEDRYPFRSHEVSFRLVARRPLPGSHREHRVARTESFCDGSHAGSVA